MKDMGLLENEQAESQVGMNAPEGDQKIYDNVIHAGMAMLYKKSVTEKVVGLLEQSRDLPLTIGQIVNMLGESIIKKNKGKDIPDEVLFHAASELIDLIIELAEKIGIKVDDEVAEQAFYKAMEIWADANPSKSMSDIASLKEDFDSLPPEAVRDVQQRFMRKTPIAEGVQRAMGA